MPKPILLEVMKARAGIPTNDLFAMLWAKKLRAGSSSVQTLTGIPPLSFPSDGSPLISWSMKGNGSQTGTPTPDNPVMPEFVGVKTANLANLYGVNTTGLNLTFTTGNNMTLKINGTKVDGSNVRVMARPNIMLPAGTYTVKIKMIGGSITNITGGVMFGINSSTYSMRTSPQVNTVGQTGIRTFTLNEDTLLASLDIAPSYGDAGAVFSDAEFECWLYSGSDDIPYEPYGYKIPITCAGQTTPVYLGQVSTVRRVKKLVLTGEESITKGAFPPSTNCYQFGFTRPADMGTDVVKTINSHFKRGTVTNGTYIGSLYNMFPEKSILPEEATAVDFQNWLADQYAAGTPVTVWYVLAEPTTGIVNEPLCRIGDYCDELHSTDAGVTIPTVKGQNVLTVETELQPSEMSITYKG